MKILICEYAGNSQCEKYACCHNVQHSIKYHGVNRPCTEKGQCKYIDKEVYCRDVYNDGRQSK